MQVEKQARDTFFKEHGKILAGIVGGVIALVLIIALTLYFTLKPKKSKVNPSVSPFNGPSNVNGDPLKTSALFANPQTILNPDPNHLILFGEFVFVHQAGYICAVAQTPIAGGANSVNSLFFYSTDSSGVIQGPQRFDMTFLPANYVVCNGAFAPIFNIVNEVYYLFVTVGLLSPLAAGIYTRYATNVVLFSLNTGAGDTNWSLSNINGTFTQIINNVQVLKLPSSAFSWNSSNPWVGTFGDKLQVVLDDNQPIIKQSFYASGSEYDPSRPGGNVYWFVLADNSTSPTFLYISTIQDAKLLLLQNQGVAISRQPPPATDYINGFGSDFYVTSGSGTKNQLVIANSTSQDSAIINGSAQPAAPCGYVQGFVIDTSNNTLEWVQPQSGSGTFLYRYIGTPTDPAIINQSGKGGFASSVFIISGYVVIGQASPLSGDCELLFYAWSQTPYDAGNQRLTLYGTLNPSTVAANAIPQSFMTPFSTFSSANGNTLRFNFALTEIQDGSQNLVMGSWYYPSPANLVSLQNSVSTQTAQPFQDFTTLQSLGTNIDTVITAASAAAQIYLPRLGFAQYVSVWLSRTGLSVRLAINDPYYPTNNGRFLVFSKSQAG